MTTTIQQCTSDAYRVDWETDELVPLPGEAGSAVIFDLGDGRYVQCYVENGALLVGGHRASTLLVSPYNGDQVEVTVDGISVPPEASDLCPDCGEQTDAVTVWRSGARDPYHERSRCPARSEQRARAAAQDEKWRRECAARHEGRLSVTEEPQPGEQCTCGRPAVTVFVTDKFGRVGFCGIPGAQPLVVEPGPVEVDEKVEPCDVS